MFFCGYRVIFYILIVEGKYLLPPSQKKAF